MSSYSPKGEATTSTRFDVGANPIASSSSRSLSNKAAPTAHHQGLLSKLRKQAPRLFAKSKAARPSSGHSYLRQGKGGIQSEPPSFTGCSTDQDQDGSRSTSPKTSRPESSSSFFQNSAVPQWHQVSQGCWSFAQQTIQIKQTSMLILTEMEKACLREIALQILLQDRYLHSKMASYKERLGGGPASQNLDVEKKEPRHHGSMSRFFSRLSHWRFSTGSYSATNPPGQGLLHRSKVRSKGAPVPPSSTLRQATATIAEQSSTVATNLVFGATLKRCLANEILAERKRLMRLERQSRSGRLPLPSTRRLEPLPSGQEDRLQIPTEKPGNTGGNKRQHLPLNRRSSVNGVGLTRSGNGHNSSEKAAPVIHPDNSNNELVNDDADSGFQEDNEAPPVKATSFDTGRRFERCGESAGPMPLQVPQFVRKCVRHIETYGLDVEGIFRLGTSKKRIKSQIAEIQRSADFNFTADQSVHDTAALLKEFFRDLPEPLLTRSLYAAFVAVGSIDDKTLCHSLLRLLILLLPSVHRDTLYFLLVFLRSVASHALGVEGRGNKMTSHNLATLFGPNILRMSGLQGDQSKQGDAFDAEMMFTAMLKSSDQLQPSSSATLPRKSSQQFVVESQDRADERLAVIAVVQILIEDCENIFQIPIDLMDQMFTKMFQGDFGSMHHNSTVVKAKHHWITPSSEAIERLLLKRAGCRLVRTATGDLVEAELQINNVAPLMLSDGGRNNDCCCSSDYQDGGQEHHAPSCCYNDSTVLSCASFSVQSSPAVADKGRNNGTANDEGATKPTADEFITATLHPATTACVSRSEGDLAGGRRSYELALDDPRYFRLTGRPRPRRYGESYAAKIRISEELLQDATTWDELRTAIAQNPQSPSSNTMPRITVTVATSSAPDTPIPSQPRA